MNIFKRKKIVVLTVCVLIAALVIPAYADVTQSDIDEALAVKAEEERELASTEERLTELERLRGDNEAYLNELSIQLSELAGQLDDIRNLCSEKEAELEEVRAELARQNALADEQYEDMKVRIQYMYEETSNTGILEALFSAGSFTDFINRAETMSELNRYDRDMLDSYSRTISAIEENKEELLREQEELTAAEEMLIEQQDQIREIYQTTYNDLRYYSEEIEQSSAAERELVATIRSQQESIDYLMAAAYQEEIARREREAAEAAAQAASQDPEGIAQSEAAYEEAAPAEPVYDEEETGGAEEAVPDESSPEESSPEEPSAEEPSAEEPSPEEQAEEAGEPEPEEAEEPSEDTGLEGTYLGNFTLTAYCGCSACCGQWASDNPTTASGAPCVEGVTVAMGGVPFGTKLLINGNVYTVQDRGTAYGHVDIYFASHASALAFGLKHADVYRVG